MFYTLVVVKYKYNDGNEIYGSNLVLFHNFVMHLNTSMPLCYIIA